MTTQPAIVPDGIYSRQQVEKNLGISDGTLTAWIEFNGLEPIRPGTKSAYFLGSEVIAFMVKFRAGNIVRPTGKQRAELRKKGGAR